MKQIQLFLILVLIVSLGSSLKIRKNNKPKFDAVIKFDLNQSYLDEFGLPIKSEYRSSVYCCFNETQILYDTIDNNGYIAFEAKDSLIYFTYEKDSLLLSGQYIIPPFYEMDYSRSYDAITLMVVRLKPFQVYNPIRYGDWKLEINGESEKISYSIKLDKLSKGCE